MASKHCANPNVVNIMTLPTVLDSDRDFTERSFVSFVRLYIYNIYSYSLSLILRQSIVKKKPNSLYQMLVNSVKNTKKSGNTTFNDSKKFWPMYERSTFGSFNLIS